MSGENEEEQALDRLSERLDRAFASARPRAGFEEELLSRLRVAPPRTRRSFDGARWGAVAATLLVVAGAGYGLTHSGRGGPAASSTSGSGAAYLGGPGPLHAQVATAFGPLPRPARMVASGAAPGAVDRAGAASLSLPAAAPVLRYAEPSPADADAFATARGASPQGAGPQGRVYAAPGFTLTITPTNPATGVAASFSIVAAAAPEGGSGPSASTAQAAAQRFLEQHGLVPASPNRVEVTVQPNQPTVVRFIPQVGASDLVTAAGAPAGLYVLVTGAGAGTVTQAAGPLPLGFETAAYPLAPFEELQRQAGPGYSSAALVYVLAFEGTRGYLEPAVLFTGSGRPQLVPAVASSQLRP